VFDTGTIDLPPGLRRSRRAGLVDTEPAIQAMVVQRFRSMSPSERAQVARGWSEDLTRFARAGIANQRPTLRGQDLLHELARRRYGRGLADEVYGSRSP